MLETWVTFYFNGLTKQLRYLRATRASLDRESSWVTTQNERQKSPRKECSIIKQKMVHSTYLDLTASDSRNQTRKSTKLGNQLQSLIFSSFGTFRVASRSLPFCHTLHKNYTSIAKNKFDASLTKTANRLIVLWNVVDLW